MDTLSQILQTIRTRSPLIADLSFGNNVSIGLPALGGLPFHYVVKGNCRLETGEDSVELAAGDFVMVARLPYYRFETAAAPSASRSWISPARTNFWSMKCAPAATSC